MREVALGTVCVIKNGYAFKSSEFQDKGTPLIRISNFDNGSVFFNEKTAYVDSKYLETKSAFKVEKGDVLIALSGATTGKFGLYTKDEPSLLNQRIGLLKSGASKELDDKFFYFYLSILKKEILRKAGGAAQPNISTKTISEFKIPLPPLPQQKKIAAILDAADAYRQKTKALIAKYEELTQSLFLEMFGDPVINPMEWDKLALSKCYVNKKEGTKCGPFGSALKKHDYVDNGIPVWTMYNIKPDGFDNDKCLFITPEKFQDLKSYETKLGDIIISRAGTVGKMCVITYAEKAIISTNLIRLRLDKGVILPMYFSLLMNKWGPKVARLRKGSEGAFTHMNTGILNDITLPIPPINLQNQFAERIQAIEAQKSQAQASLAKAEDLFNSLLQKAFKGELT